VLVVPPGQVVCVTASGQPGRGFESAVMPKVKHFLAFSRFSLVFHGFYPEFQRFFGLNIYHTCLWRRLFCFVFFVTSFALIN
jgi:hypothetical protein